MLLLLIALFFVPVQVESGRITIGTENCHIVVENRTSTSIAGLCYIPDESDNGDIGA